MKGINTITATQARLLAQIITEAEIAATALLGAPVNMAITSHNIYVNPEHLNTLIHNIANLYNITINDITGASRVKHLVEARQLFWYIGRRHYKYGYKKLGQYTGGRDHSTIMHGVNQIQNYLDTGEAQITNNLNQIIKTIQQTKTN